ncbi:MAG TPA: flagellar basal body P-ring protein FlgI [Candidatus Methylacidiphilales bacterium]|jgi:flagellar P-ring protein precursor FlgI|nr:flagellar basal body P-ring protein FlgI [Candidatus Methylacidiphilales bacterium]
MNSSLRSNPTFHGFEPHRFIAKALLIILTLLAVTVLAQAQTRIKDVATVGGARDNQLLGYGIVAGLDGQGDSDKQFTQQTIANLARKFGLIVPATDITNKNVAIVMVTANIPAFTHQGTKLNVTVASLADAKSLQGGVLLQTPMVAGDGQVYAVAQGSVFLGGFDAGTGGAGGSSIQKNHTTSGVVTDGAIVEQEIPTSLFSKGLLEIVLRQGDFTSAVRMANAINDQIGHIAEAVSPTTVQVFVPPSMQCPEKQMEFVARIENAQFVPDMPARIVINERTGTIVANANIQIAKVAVAYGNLTVAITNTQSVSQPNSFTGNGNTIDSGNRNSGTINNSGSVGNNAGNGIHTQVVDNTTTNVQEEKRAMVVLNDMPTVEDVAFALNSMGATPRELMSILQSIKDAGALNAELVLE